jgi:predicted dehydrogenase
MKVLIIGCGSIGKRHLGNFRQIGVSQLGAVDPRPDRRQEVKERFGITDVYSSTDEAVRDGYEAALVGVPTHYHIDVAEQLVSAGIHLLVEKPIADRVDGVCELLNRASRSGLCFMVGYTYRFWPPLLKIKNLIEQGTFGRIYSVQITFSEYLPDWHPWEDYRSWFMAKKELGGGAMLDESHTLDIARWLFGEIESVFCINGQFSHLEITSDDLAEMVVSFRSGTIGNIHMDIFGRHHRKEIVVVGERANCYWDFYTNQVRVYDAEGQTWQNWQFTCDRNDMFLSEARHFLDCIARKTSPLVDGYDGLKTLQLILAAQNSSRSGRLVQTSYD